MSVLHLTSYILHQYVVPGRLELPTSTLSVWRSNQLSYRTGMQESAGREPSLSLPRYTEKQKQKRTRRKVRQKSEPSGDSRRDPSSDHRLPRPITLVWEGKTQRPLQKGGVPAAPSGTATLLRLSPNHLFHPRPTLAVTDFRRPRLSWLDGRCVQGPGTYSPRHG